MDEEDNKPAAPAEGDNTEDNKSDDVDNKEGENKENDKPEEKEGEKNDDEFQDDNTEPDGSPAPAPVDKKESDEDEDLTQDDEEKIGKIVEKRMKPLEDTLHTTRVEADLNNLFATHPEYKKYEPRIRRFVTHPNRVNLIKNGLPVSTVALEAVSPYIEQIAAAKAKAADAKANLTKNDGASSRPTEAPKVDWGKLSNKEIEAEADLIKQGRSRLNKAS